MQTLTEYFDQFLRERVYLRNITPKTKQSTRLDGPRVQAQEVPLTRPLHPIRGQCEILSC